MSKYFYKDVSGLDSDITRHREEEKHLRNMIEQLSNSIDESDNSRAKVYQYLLKCLLESKAKMVANIGKKK